MKGNHPNTTKRMKDDRPGTVALDSFNTHTNQVHDSYNDNSKNITDNRHFGDKIGTIINKLSFSTARGLDILQENAVPGAAYDSSECQSTPVCPRTRTVVLDRVEKWADADDDCAICWMHGPAGIGKTSLATTIAMKYAEEKRLAGSFFFSRDPACHAGRRSVSKVFATIAYQMSTSHPTAKRKLRGIIDKDPLILSNSLEHQFSHLIIAPFQPFRSGLRFFATLCVFSLVTALSSITSHTHREHIKTLDHRLPMIVVIDALDECSENVVALITVLAHVYRDSPPPIRFFLTSRPEDHIRGKFRIPGYSQRTHFIDLNDFQARDDIRIFLRAGFSSLYTELEDYMRGVGKPWPSEEDLETVVEKSEGLFIYASTLLKFVGDVEGQGLLRECSKKSLPQARLKKAIERHDGLDGLYRQVLGDAPFRSDPNFDVLLGAMCFLYDPLGMDNLTDLMQFNGTGETRLLLRGCRSILRIPESDTDEISFFHASLRDFLTDQSRSREEYFLDPVVQHIHLLDRCIRAIATSRVTPKQNIKPSISYAWKNWHRHMHAALESSNAVRRLKGHLGNRFEASLAYVLDFIVSESPKLCDTWKLLLHKLTIGQRDGLDGLYRHVLGNAPFRSDPNFDVLLGVICFLYDPLGMEDLTDLLQLDNPAKNRLRLKGCRSILRIPESDTDEISFFHPSLRDFLTDRSRSREEYFLDPVIQHIYLLDRCIQAITTSGVTTKQDIKPSISYAWKNWHRHMHAALQSSNAVHRLKAHFGEHFEAGLVHFLDSIISESSDLGDTWELVLRTQRVSWREIVPMLEDMVQDTKLLFPMSKILKMVKFLGSNPTLHWRTARTIFDRINDNLNITLVGVDEAELDLKQLLTDREESAAKLSWVKFLNSDRKLMRSLNIAFTLTTPTTETMICKVSIIYSHGPFLETVLFLETDANCTGT